jgi:hypothetical protein
LTEQLGDIRLIDASGLGAMVTGPSAIDLGSLVTPLGGRFVRLLSEE